MLLREDLMLDFCRSIDTMDDDPFNSFRDMARSILINEFGTIHSDVKLDGGRSDGVPALDTIRLDSKTKDYNLVPVQTTDGSYTSQRAFCYDNGCPLWITTKNGTPIARTKANDVIIEQWGKFEGDFAKIRRKIPRYQDFDVEGGACTSVIVPLRYGSSRPRVFGVLCLEFKEKIERNQHTTDRVGTIARAISKAIWLREMTKEQRRGTSVALQALEARMASMPKGPGLHLPKVFFAFSSRADSDVYEHIVSAVEGFSDRVQLDDWKKHKTPGLITSEIRKSIASATYGICYFSEPAGQKAEFPYVDNRNVLIEAGMLDAAFHRTAGTPSRWLLIREEHAGDHAQTNEPPFDITDQRFLIVPRRVEKKNSTSKLDTRKFREDLDAFLSALFSDS